MMVMALSGMRLVSAIGFFERALAGVLRAALADFDDLDVAESEATSALLGALSKALRQLSLGTVLQPADGGDHQPHETSALLLGRFVPAHIFSMS